MHNLNTRILKEASHGIERGQAELARKASVTHFVPGHSRCPSCPDSFQILGSWVLWSLTLSPAHPNTANLPITSVKASWAVGGLSHSHFMLPFSKWNLLTNTESVRKIFIRPLASNPTFHLSSLNLQIWSTYTHSVKYENNVHIYVLYKDSSIYG